MLKLGSSMFVKHDDVINNIKKVIKTVKWMKKSMIDYSIPSKYSNLWIDDINSNTSEYKKSLLTLVKFDLN